MTPIHFQSALKMAASIRARDVSATELLELHLARVKQHNAPINAVIVLDEERARARARQADAALAKGQFWGPLHGVPMTVKEAFDIEGLVTTFGYENQRDNVANTDALAVARLKRAGAVIFGKTNVPVALADWQTFNPIYGTTNNPFDFDRVPGGSSGGSAAALAAGLTPLEVGSDIGASIRNPAHFCGVFGHKPTFGALSMKGHWVPPHDAMPELDIGVIGPMARSADDLAVALDILSGPDDIDAVGVRVQLPSTKKREPTDFKVGIIYNDEVADVDAEVQGALRELAAVLKDAGVTVHEGARPPIDSIHGHYVYLNLLRAATSQYLTNEVVEQHVQMAQGLHDDDDRYEANMYRGSSMSHRHWLRLSEERYRLRHIWAEWFESYDLLLCPAATSVAFPHMQEGERWERMISVNGKPQPTTTPLFWAGYPGSVYLPATVAPLPPGASGLPTGVQIIGPQYRDHRCIAFAALVEQLTGGFRAPTWCE
jgi:amidase